jgi:hypothetical protein
VVSGEDVERGLERRQQLAQLLVLGIGRMVGQVSGEEHRLRLRHDLPNALDRRGKPGDGIPAAPVRAEVGVAELDEDERSRQT